VTYWIYSRARPAAERAGRTAGPWPNHGGYGNVRVRAEGPEERARQSGDKDADAAGALASMARALRLFLPFQAPWVSVRVNVCMARRMRILACSNQSEKEAADGKVLRLSEDLREATECAARLQKMHAEKANEVLAAQAQASSTDRVRSFIEEYNRAGACSAGRRAPAPA
jgi:hypothetical protein